MKNIKILDCTLRDGGYVNNWHFGLKNQRTIIERLCKSNIEYLEVGFLQNVDYQNDKSLFNEISQINNVIPNFCTSQIVGMIVYGTFDINKIIPKTEAIRLDAIRVTLKKRDLESIIPFLKKIIDCGYKLFINPTNIESYSDSELLSILEIVNELQPYGFSIVDTNGVLKERDVQRLFFLIDNNLNKNIKLCFHSHNNLQLSFSNAQCLMKGCQNRELIIDSTVFGMGRGAGNLCTELITQYINDNYNGNYDIIPILKIVDEQINPIFAQTPWGYSVPYYLAATNHCHPNYAKYLVDKQTVPVEIINKLLQTIPTNKKAVFDINLIKQVYLDNFSKVVNDKDVLKFLKSYFIGKNILVLAPGKSLQLEGNKIKDFIKNNKPLIISLNFKPKNYVADLTFVSNIKRFSTLEQLDSHLVVTSNIENYPQNAMVLNYSSYLNNSKMYDNVALIFFKLLIQLGINNVNIAGLDGFSNVASENYISGDLINNAKESEFDERNQIMSQELSRISKEIKIHFVTNTKYYIKENLCNNN